MIGAMKPYPFAGDPTDAGLPTCYHAAGCVVFDSTGQVLLLARPARGEWRLPKGHVEAGEEARTAALRETTEESGYADLETLNAIGEQWVLFHWRGAVIRRRESFFTARLLSGAQKVRPADDAGQFEVHWFPSEEAGRRLSFAGERNVLLKALAVRDPIPAPVDKAQATG